VVVEDISVDRDLVRFIIDRQVVWHWYGVILDGAYHNGLDELGITSNLIRACLLVVLTLLW